MISKIMKTGKLLFAIIAAIMLIFGCLIVVLPIYDRARLINVADTFISEQYSSSPDLQQHYWESKGFLFSELVLLSEYDVSSAYLNKGNGESALHASDDRSDKMFLIDHLLAYWPEIPQISLQDFSFYRGDLVSASGSICQDDRCSYYALAGENRMYLMIIAL